MKALVLREYNRLAYEDVPAPQPAPGEVLVAVKACGICGSDVHGMDGSTGRRRPPIIMGHEAAGVIAEIGDNVKDWKAGDRVTFDSTIYCGQCEFCRQGEINLCDRRRVLGVSCEEYRQNGAMAEYVVVPERILYRLRAELAFEHAALIEPFSIAVHAVGRAGIQRTSEPPEGGTTNAVVVIGAGMIGLAVIQVLRAAGLQRLIVVDISEERLALALKLGVAAAINPAAKDALTAIKDLTEGQGSGVAVEAVGALATVDLAVRSVRKGGSVVLVGNIAPSVQFPLQVAVTRELTVYGSCASRGDYPACIEMMASGALDPGPLISAVAPLAEGAAWFERLYGKEAGLLKVVLKP